MYNKCNVLSVYQKILAVAVIINFPQILAHCYLHLAFVASKGATELTRVVTLWEIIV